MITPANHKGANSEVNQSEFVTGTCSKRGKNRAYKERLVLALLLIGWKTDAKFPKPITKRSNRNGVITFDSHLKTALTRDLLARQMTTGRRAE